MRRALALLVLAGCASGPHPGVRRSAVEVSPSRGGEALELARRLGDLDIAERDAAEQALLALGARAVPALAAVVDEGDLEAVGRARRILDRGAPAWDWTAYRARATSVLELQARSGDAPAQELVRRLTSAERREERPVSIVAALGSLPTRPVFFDAGVGARLDAECDWRGPLLDALRAALHRVDLDLMADDPRGLRVGSRRAVFEAARALPKRGAVDLHADLRWWPLGEERSPDRY